MDKKLVVVAAVSFAAGSLTTVAATVVATKSAVKKHMQAETETTPDLDAQTQTTN